MTSTPPTGEMQRMHENLWALGPATHAATLLAMALHRRMPELNGFLDAVEARTLQDTEERLTEWQSFMFSKELVKAYPDRRAIGQGTKPVIKFAPIDAFALVFSDHHGDDEAHPQRALTQIDPERRKLLDRALNIFSVESLGDRHNPDFGSTLAERISASVLMNCRDPAICSLVLKGLNTTTPINMRTKLHGSEPEDEESLARAAMVSMNPAAIHAILDLPNLHEPQQAANQIKPRSAFDHLISGIFRHGIKVGAIASSEAIVHIMADEFEARTAAQPRSMTSAIERLFSELDSNEAAVLHGTLLSKAVQAAGKDERYDPVEMFILQQSQQSKLGTWYSQADESEFRRPGFANPAGNMIDNVLFHAAYNGRAHVMSEFDPELRAMASAVNAMLSSDPPKKSANAAYNATSCALFAKACTTMVEDDKVISAQSFRDTVDIFVRTGFDLSLCGSARSSTDTASTGDTVLHSIARQSGDAVLTAMLHLVEVGFAPECTNKKGKTPGDMLKSKGLKDPWEAALRSQVARAAALDALKDLDSGMGNRP